MPGGDYCPPAALSVSFSSVSPLGEMAINGEGT